MRREAAAPETELVVLEQINAIELFTGGKVDPILEEITRKAKEFIPDLKTGSSRKKIASMARKVASSKTLLDKLGKELVADWKTKAKQVDSSRKHIRDYLDNLRDEVRQPLTDWEAEKERKEEEERKHVEYLADWDSAICDNDFFNREREVARKEAEFAKLEEERRVKEQAEADEKERIANEARIKKEASERAEKEAKEKIEAAEREKIRIKLEAEQDKIDTAQKAEKDKQDAIAEVKRKAKAEADRIESERVQTEKDLAEKLRQEKIASEKKASHWKHQAKINNEIRDDMNTILSENAFSEILDVSKVLITAIAQGKIRNLSIKY